MNLGTIRNWLQGRKTYGVTLAAMLTLLTSWSAGKVTTHEAVKDAFGLMLAATMRAAVAKLEEPAEPEPKTAKPRKKAHVKTGHRS